MSTCISSYGEYSSHEFSDYGTWEDRFTCGLCGVVDDAEAVRRLTLIDAIVARWEIESAERGYGDVLDTAGAAAMLRAAIGGRA